MSTIVTKCPRCAAQDITMDVKAVHVVANNFDWKTYYEAFCVCRHCDTATIFKLADKSPTSADNLKTIGGPLVSPHSLNRYLNILGHISPRHNDPRSAPEHLPDEIRSCFEEATACMTIGCWNAAGVMFRMALDKATKGLLPDEGEAGLNRQIRRSLGLRLQWLFDNNILPEALRDLSTCIKEDGNDGAHDGTLQEADVEDLFDFATAILERLYTEPHKLKLASERRDARRSSNG